MATPARHTIKALRLEAGLSRAELADGMGSAYSTIYGIETGNNPTSSEDYLAKLALFFTRKLSRKVHLVDLIDAADPKSEPKKPEPRPAPTPRPDIPRPVAPPRPPGPKRDGALVDPKSVSA